MALLPISILRSTLIVKETKNKLFVSTTFIAKFEDLSNKFLNKKGWVDKNLFNKSDEGDKQLLKSDCTLYYRDWLNNPTFSDFYKNYPKTLLSN